MFRKAGLLPWVLICISLALLIQAGFAFVEMGHSWEVQKTHGFLMSRFGLTAVVILGFWISGFGLMSGIASAREGFSPSSAADAGLLTVEHTMMFFGKPFGLFGGTGFFVNPGFGSAAVGSFVFQAVLISLIAAIPGGAMLDRWSLKSRVAHCLWVGIFPCAVFGNWVWGGGWLAQLGQNFAWGHGAVDFAGSGVVHLAGGVLAFFGAAAIGPRLGKYDDRNQARDFLIYSRGKIVLGTALLGFGFLALNVCFAPDVREIGSIILNTLLAAAASLLTAGITLRLMIGKPDMSRLSSGFLAGFAAIAAPWLFVSPTGALVVGACAGVLVVFSMLFVERTLKVDDPVGAISVHGACGAFGVLSVGLLANGSSGAGWGGVHKLFKDGVWEIVNATPGTRAYYELLLAGGWSDLGVSGGFSTLFGGVANDYAQIKAQCAEVAACLLFVGTASYLWFKLSDLLVSLRTPVKVDIEKEKLLLGPPE
jgi:Amt family ammonium transporter